MRICHCHFGNNFWRKPEGGRANSFTSLKVVERIPLRVLGWGNLLSWPSRYDLAVLPKEWNYSTTLNIHLWMTSCVSSLSSTRFMTFAFRNILLYMCRSYWKSSLFHQLLTAFSIAVKTELHGSKSERLPDLTS